MRKTIISITFILLLLLPMALFACDDSVGNSTPLIGEYVLQYSLNNEVKEIHVETGKNYSISPVPQKEGYDFSGLYDSETGGTQYINSSGLSVTPWNETAGKTLVVRWTPKTYTIAFNCGEGVEGQATPVTVAYDSVISNIPTNIERNGYTFIGWYSSTADDAVQYADRTGILPDKLNFNRENFPLASNSAVIFYAKYRLKVYTVYYDYNDGSKTYVTVEVPHGKRLNDYAPDAIKETGGVYKAVSFWSLSKAGNKPYDGTADSDITLYAQWANAVVLEENGGSKVNDVVQDPGEPIILPSPEKVGYTFKGWKTESGENFTSTVMPENGIKLFASWAINSYTVTYDANGGKCSTASNVVQYGAKISYPTPSRSNYTFNGWTNAPEYMGASDFTATATWTLITKRSFTFAGGTVDDLVGDSVSTSFNLNNNFDMAAIKNTYVNMKIYVAFYATENNKGYQEFYVSTGTYTGAGNSVTEDSKLTFADCVSPRMGGAVNATASPADYQSWTNIETAGTQKGSDWHYFTLYANSGRFDSTGVVVFTWGAHGGMGDEWILSNVSVEISFYS